MSREVEEWRPIEGFPGYDVSDHGRVRSYRLKGPKGRKDTKAGPKIGLIPTLRKPQKGAVYLHVTLRKDNKLITKTIHILVARAFLGPCPSGQEVLHGPEGKHENGVWNLSYGSHSQNMIDKARDGNDSRGEKHPLNKLSTQQAMAVINDRRNSYVIAKELGVSQSLISHIRTGRNRSYLREKVYKDEEPSLFDVLKETKL